MPTVIHYRLDDSHVLKSDNKIVSAMSQAPSSPSDVSDYMVAIVAPAWLQGGLAVVVKSIPQVRLVACTGSVPIFLLLLHEARR